MNMIGENIKRLRKIRNLNQTDFANKIGVSQGSLSDLESGKSKPAIETVISICSVFSWIQSKLETWDTEALFQYRELAPYAREAVPTNEHFIPLLLAMGTGDAGRNAKLLHRSSYQYGNLSLSCWQYTGISRQCLHVS